MRSRLTVILLGLGAVSFWVSPLFGQATFTAAATQATGADIGFAELTGGLVFTVESGTSVASDFSIKYSAPITNNSASEIIVTCTWAAISQAPLLNKDTNTIQISVPAGGIRGSSIRLAGVRVELAGHDYTKVSATVTSSNPSGNAIMAGQSVLTVIDSIQEPFSVTLADAVTWSDGESTNEPGAVRVKVEENYDGAFTSSIGLYGQNAVTQIRINPFPEAIPAGVSLTFPATVTSPDSGATFATASGQSETVPRSDGSSSVVYSFSSVPVSNTTAESFSFVVTPTVQSPATSGRITFQVTLLPIATDDSTEVPRYTERIVPDETELGFGTSELAFPFQSESSGIYTGIAITNPIAARVKVILTAYDASGTAISGANITNPATVEMPRSGQFARVASEIFGQNFNAGGAGTIRATAQTSLMPGFYLEGKTGGQGLDGTTAEISPMQSWTLPSIAHAGPSPFTLLQLFNPGSDNAAVTLKLFNQSGSQIASESLPLLAGGTISRDLEDIFAGVNLNSLSGGYILGSSPAGLIVSENFGDAIESNIIQGQPVIQQKSFKIAHFASGGGYSTELNIINRDTSVSASVTLTVYGNDGTVIPIAGNPHKLIIAPSAQLLQTVDQLFPSLGSSLKTGYIQLDIEPFFIGPFGSVASVTGSVRFSAADGTGSATLPLFISPVTDFVYSHIAQNLGYYTGIAVLNLTSAPATLRVQAFTKDGLSVGSYLTYLAPGQKISSLLYQMIPATLGQIGGYVHIESDQPVLSFSLFGTDDGKVLSAIPPQNMEQ